ncbi:MAG: pitrilysin family protein [Planctomycetota bacterium]
MQAFTSRQFSLAYALLVTIFGCPSLMIGSLQANEPNSETPATKKEAVSTEAPAPAPETEVELEKVVEIEGISEYRLDNGVRLLLFPEPSKEVVTVNMTVFVGSRHEGYGEAGMAHLLEHMLFKGTPTHPDIPKALKDRGAGNSMNGTTWTDRTNYYETLPSTDENLEFALRLEADRLVNSYIKGEDLESEMTVVRNEFESGENSPFRILMQRITSAAYDWHNYGKSTIGNLSDIERVPVVSLRRFYRKFYRPDNVMVVVAGKFDQAKAIECTRKYFGSLTVPDTPIDGTYTTEPAQDGERTIVLRRVGESQIVGSAYHIPAGSHPDFAAAKALVYILGDEPSGRLYKGLVESEIASNVYTLAYSWADPGMFMNLVEIPKDKSLEAARSKLVEILEDSLESNPITEKELDRAVQQILKGREMEAADTNRLAISLSEWAAQGDWRLYFLYRDAIEALTVEDVQRVAKKYFVSHNRTIGLFIPTEESLRANIPEAPDLMARLEGYKGREAVAAGEAFDPDPVAIENRIERGPLIDGMKYAVLPKKTRGSTVRARLTLRFGDEESMADRIAAIELLGIFMQRGTESLTFTELQDELTRLRTEMSVSSTIGLLQVSLETNREFLPEVIDLLGEVLRKPSFEAEELEVLRRQLLTSLEKGKVEPQSLAIREIRRSLSPFAKGHPLYSPTIDEEIEMYENVTIDEIRDVHQRFLSTQGGELVAVGDFDKDALLEQVRGILSDWGSDIPYIRIDRPANTSVSGKHKVIQIPDKANAFMFSSQQYALEDTDPEYASLVLGNFILGGGSLSSRLGNRVRQQEGLSYGVRSMLSARAKDQRVDFTIYAITNPDNRVKLIDVIMEELDKIRDDGITDEELAEAKEAYLQSNRVSRSNDGSVASEILGTIFNERTMQQVADHEEQIREATVDSVNSAIQKYIDPERLVLAIAGDFEKEE